MGGWGWGAVLRVKMLTCCGGGGRGVKLSLLTNGGCRRASQKINQSRGRKLPLLCRYFMSRMSCTTYQVSSKYY